MQIHTSGRPSLIQSLWLAVRGKIGSLQRREIYFSQYGPNGNAYYTLFFSELPTLQALIENLPSPRFQNKYLILYLGKNCVFNEEAFKKANIRFKTLDYGPKNFLILDPNAIEIGKLFELTRGAADWWLLTLAKPQDSSGETSLHQINSTLLKEHLTALGMISGPAACRSRFSDLHGEILLNYFEDPSFHSAFESDLAVLLDLIVAATLQRLYQESPETLLMRQNEIFKKLELDFSQNNSAVQMRAFTISGGLYPVILRRDWPSGQRLRAVWNGERWQNTHLGAEPRWQRTWTLARPYFIPALLVPVAIVIIPLTATLWAVRSLWKQFLSKILLEKDGAGEDEDL